MASEASDEDHQRPSNSSSPCPAMEEVAVLTEFTSWSFLSALFNIL